jgi:hypothetical protein
LTSTCEGEPGNRSSTSISPAAGPCTGNRPGIYLDYVQSVRDGSLNELDTKSLEIKRCEGGGNHSNMAFFENYIVATDNFRSDTRLRIVDRGSGKIASETAAGSGGHSVAVNEKRAGRASGPGRVLHVVSLAEQTLGMHLGILERPRKERS